MNLLAIDWKFCLAIAVLFVDACAIPVVGQQISIENANATCVAGLDTQFGHVRKSKDLLQLAAFEQRRQANQAKVEVGMTRDDVLQLLGPPDIAGAAWLDNADPHCVWAYNRIREPEGSATRGDRDLVIHISFSKRVIGIHFQPVMFTNSEGLGIQRK